MANLAKVGREMVFSTDDSILQQDMPLAITKVSETLYFLSHLFPYSFFAICAVLRIHLILMRIRILDPYWKKMDPDPNPDPDPGHFFAD